MQCGTLVSEQHILPTASMAAVAGNADAHWLDSAVLGGNFKTAERR